MACAELFPKDRSNDSECIPQLKEFLLSEYKSGVIYPPSTLIRYLLIALRQTRFIDSARYILLVEIDSFARSQSRRPRPSASSSLVLFAQLQPVSHQDPYH